jgi:hypothetical protein
MMLQIRCVVRATRALMAVRVVGMALAQIGPFTAMLESVAAAVGAGVVLGSVYSGLRGLRRSPLREIERGALSGGYFGGAIGAVLVVVDILVRYGWSK